MSNVYNRCLRIVYETDKPVLVVEAPPVKGKSGAIDEEAAFKFKIKKVVAGSTTECAKASARSKVLFEKSGYDFSGNVGVIVQQREVEIDFGKGFKKRYKLRVPIQG